MVGFTVWSPRNFTVDTYVLDANYFFKWYVPRELKYYFRLYLPTLAERVNYRAKQLSGSPFPGKADVRRALVQLLVMPPLQAPKPPPQTVQPPIARFDDDPNFEAALAQLELPVAGTKRPRPDNDDADHHSSPKRLRPH